LGVQDIVKTHFTPSHNADVMEGPFHEVEVVQNLESMSPSGIGGQSEDNVLEEPRLDDCGNKLLMMLGEVEALVQQVRSSIGDYTREEKNHKIHVLKSFLASLSQPFTFERPSTIDLPRRGSSIAEIQENVKRTRMGHGKKRAVIEDDGKFGGQPTSKRPAHVLLSHSKQKRAIFPKILKVSCDICATKTIVERGENSISCKNCDHELFVSRS
jgi:ribosomal protein S27E